MESSSTSTLGLADAGSPDSGAPDSGPLCGTLGVLVDDFSMGVISPDWGWRYQNGGGTLEETGGALQFNMAPMVTGDAFVRTQSTYHFEGSSVTIQVLELPAPASGVRAALALSDDDQRWAMVELENNRVRFKVNNGAGPDTLGDFGHSLAAASYFRMAQEAGVLSMDSSANGITWDNQVSVPSPFVLNDMVRLEIAFSTSVPQPQQGKVRVDNVIGAPAATHCPFTEFHDDFSTDEGPVLWRNSYLPQECGYTLAGNHLTLLPPARVSAVCQIHSSAFYDPGETGGVQLEMVPGAPQTDQQGHYFAVGSPVRGYDYWQARGLLYMRAFGDGQVLLETPTAYNPVAHKFLRHARSGDRHLWQTSPDGVRWTTRADFPDTFRDPWDVLIGVDVYGLNTSPVAVVLGNVKGSH